MSQKIHKCRQNAAITNMYYYIDTWSLYDIVFGVSGSWFEIIEYNIIALTLVTCLIDTHNLTTKMAVEMALVCRPIPPSL